ncbi:hypothetical protein PAXINDRAFT_169402 [Paxillus involutus ATCC 200175]|jgi:hypothetical protein|uniref:Uncharacterized protein n=1 Tax=Paxillus involutus ATCC 200175 TaxID=664439 RepID=A0A0C9U6E5_PAXIN|nr:hypothetical protein PAXINDRAFT_169402 [Paxillus involutus ATCC 200175]
MTGYGSLITWKALPHGIKEVQFTLSTLAFPLAESANSPSESLCTTSMVGTPNNSKRNRGGISSKCDFSSDSGANDRTSGRFNEDLS